MVCPYPSAVESGVLSIFTIFLPLQVSSSYFPPNKFCPPRAGFTTEVSVADVHEKAARRHTEIAGCFFFFFSFRTGKDGEDRAGGKVERGKTRGRTLVEEMEQVAPDFRYTSRNIYIYTHIYKRTVRTPKNSPN